MTSKLKQINNLTFIYRSKKGYKIFRYGSSSILIAGQRISLESMF